MTSGAPPIRFFSSRYRPLFSDESKPRVSTSTSVLKHPLHGISPCCLYNPSHPHPPLWGQKQRNCPLCLCRIQPYPLLLPHQDSLSISNSKKKKTLLEGLVARVRQQMLHRGGCGNCRKAERSIAWRMREGVLVYCFFEVFSLYVNGFRFFHDGLFDDDCGAGCLGITGGWWDGWSC